MGLYVTSVTSNSFILSDDGKYIATILGTTHGLGNAVHISKCIHRNNDLSLENLVCSYKVEPNGDVKIYADEPMTMRLTITNDIED